MFIGLIEMIVTPHHDVEGALLHRGCDDDFFHSGIKVGLEQLGGAVGSRRIDDDVNVSEIHIRRAGGIAVSDSLTAYGNAVGVVTDVAIPATVHGIELQQMSRSLRASVEFIDASDGVGWIVPAGAEAESAHAAEAVDCDIHFRVVRSEGMEERGLAAVVVWMAELRAALAAVFSEKIHEPAHAFNVQLVNDRSAVALRSNQPRMAELLEVEGECGFGDTKLERYFPSAKSILTPFNQESKNL